jgi:hypothetical protein
MFDVTFEGRQYSVILTEDTDPESGYTSWEIYDDDGEDVTNVKLESDIIAYVIENM